VLRVVFPEGSGLGVYFGDGRCGVGRVGVEFEGRWHDGCVDHSEHVEGVPNRGNVARGGCDQMIRRLGATTAT